MSKNIYLSKKRFERISSPKFISDIFISNNLLQFHWIMSWKNLERESFFTKFIFHMAMEFVIDIIKRDNYCHYICHKSNYVYSLMGFVTRVIKEDNNLSLIPWLRYNLLFSDTFCGNMF